MITALLERWRRELAAVPAHLSWISACDPVVLATYLRWKRALVMRGMPIVAVCLVVQGVVKSAHLLPVGNPLSVSLYLVCFGILGWPVAYGSLGMAFWQGVRGSPAVHRTRLWGCAIAFFSVAAVTTVCLVVLWALVIYAWVRFVAA